MEGRTRVLLELRVALFCGKDEVDLGRGGVVVMRDDKSLSDGSPEWACRISTSSIQYAYIVVSNRHTSTSSLDRPPERK